ncbi:MAG TPA: hypothetical protein VMX58_10350, partial [Patescibacteria group bacterium]|nr:hypothetical protein [Patescibacteria group bacterium]
MTSKNEVISSKRGTMDNYFTFLYVRRGNAGVRSIRIHRILALSLAVVFLALFVSTISLIVR